MATDKYSSGSSGHPPIPPGRGEAGGEKNKGEAHAKAPDKQAGDPEWAEGLRKLYDSVVEEPLPDSFKDLLSRLDEPGSDDEG